MMNRAKRFLETLELSRIVSVIRIHSNDSLVPVMEALYRGGVRVIEITATTPEYCKSIQAIRKAFSFREDCFVGAGTVLTIAQVDESVEAGADFIVSPIFDASIVAYCIGLGIPVMPGCMTPSEVFHAWKAGASVVKAFPGGSCTPGWFKDMQGPLPFIKMMPTGNVNEITAPQYINAGAIAVGVGKALASEEEIINKEWKSIEEHARRYVSLLSNI